MPEEFLDVLTADGELTGVSLPRKVVHKEGKWHRVVHVWLLNSKGEMLMQKRAMAKEAWPGLWDVGCAGHVSAGETSVEAAQKELVEELGLSFPADRFELVHTFRFEVQVKEDFLNREFADVYVVLVKDNEVPPVEQMVLQVEEVEAVRWFNIPELKEIALSRSPLFVPFADVYVSFFDKMQARHHELSSN